MSKGSKYYLLLLAVIAPSLSCCGEKADVNLVNPNQNPNQNQNTGGEGELCLFEAPDNLSGVPRSEIYKVSITQNGETKESAVFQNTCPKWELGFMDMTATDRNPLDLFAGRSISWTSFSFSGKVTVEVEVLDSGKVPMDDNVRILPSRYNISPSVKGKVIKFEMDKPGYCSVEVGANGYKNGLLIFADPLEEGAPKENTAGYVALDHATADDVKAVSSENNGIYFKPGVHNIGVFEVPAHIKNIYMPSGAWVYGSLIMKNNPNVKIFGRGILSSGKLKYRESHCIEAISGSDNVTLSGITVADVKYFAVRLIGANNNVDRTKVLGGWTYNCDGIAAYAGSTVTNCFIWANDDNIKVYRDNIKFYDIVCWQLNNGGLIQLGWTGPQSSNCEIKRIDILHAEWNRDESNRGVISLVGNKYHTAGAYGYTKNWLVEDVVTETPVTVLFNFQPDPYTNYDIDGLVMKNWNLKYDRSKNFHNYMVGTSPEHKFKGVVFDNVTVDGVRLNSSNWMTTTNMIFSNSEEPQFK